MEQCEQLWPLISVKTSRNYHGWTRARKIDQGMEMPVLEHSCLFQLVNLNGDRTDCCPRALLPEIKTRTEAELINKLKDNSDVKQIGTNGEPKK